MKIGWVLILACGVNACNSTGVKQEKTAVTDALPYYNTADFTPLWLTPKQALDSGIHLIPEFTFTNQMGQTINHETVVDKIYVANFFFTRCPGICPKLAIGMQAIQDAFKADSGILLLSHSVTPDADSVPVLMRYAKSHNVVSGKWHLLTGPQADVYNIARKGYFADENDGLGKGTDDFLHTENVLLIDKSRHIRGIYNGTNAADINNLIADIKILKLE